MFPAPYRSARRIARECSKLLPEDPKSVAHVLVKDHEVLHTDWNVALMDQVGMERYASLVETWGQVAAPRNEQVVGATQAPPVFGDEGDTCVAPTASSAR